MAKAKNEENQTLRSELREAALQEYEMGVRLLQKRDYEKAIPRFEAVLAEYGSEVALCDRARTYLRIARGETKSREPVRSTRKPEESFEVGVYLLNEGEAKEALRHLERAAEHEAEDAGVLLALASARLQCDDRDGALDALRGAIAAEPGSRVRARNMSDFEALAGDERFQALISAKD